MAKVIPITEHYQHFLEATKESFLGDACGETKRLWKERLEADSRRQPYRNGYYERDFVTRLGTIRLRIARTQGKSFLPQGMEPFQRRAEDVSVLILEAFLRGIATRQVGRVVATVSEEGFRAASIAHGTLDLRCCDSIDLSLA
jgi:transposase-like protein